MAAEAQLRHLAAVSALVMNWSLVSEALERLSPSFRPMYSVIGRLSILPEQLLRALLLQVFFSVR